MGIPDYQLSTKMFLASCQLSTKILAICQLSTKIVSC
jgi:hypothetical protein